VSTESNFQVYNYFEYQLRILPIEININVDINVADNVAQFSEYSFMNIRR